MKKREDTHLEPVILVDWDKNNCGWGYVHLQGHFRVLDTTKHDSRDTIYGEMGYLSIYQQWQAELADLRIHSQGNNKDQPRHLYGITCQWTGRDIELREAERAYKVLKRIDQGLDKINQEWGYYQSFAEYVIRVAKVLKIKWIAVRRTPAAAESTGYTYRLCDVGKEARHALDWMVAEWIKAGEPQAAAVEA